MIKKDFLPPASPYCLIQETLWPNEWKILVACVLLNRTTRKSVEKIIRRLFDMWPNPTSMTSADDHHLSSVLSPLGFKNRRAVTLKRLSEEYLKANWKHARELPGIGDYGAAAWELFCSNVMPKEKPKDHALAWYYEWRLKNADR
jgi:methyl-CpG-binding domain protein 4